MGIRMRETGVDMRESYTERYRHRRGDGGPALGENPLETDAYDRERGPELSRPVPERDDALIRADLLDRVAQRADLDTRNVDVHVNRGEVLLRGSVLSRRERALIDEIAVSVGGVATVHNQLSVSPGQTRTSGDSERGPVPIDPRRIPAGAETR